VNNQWHLCLIPLKITLQILTNIGCDFFFMNFTLLGAVTYQKKCTPSDRANILSWIQNVLHHHLVHSMDTIPDMLENLKHGTWNDF